PVSSPDLQSLLAERAVRGSARGELIFRRADGSGVPVEVTFSRFRDEQGRDLAVIIARDLSPHVAARAVLAASEAKFRSVVQAMAEGVVFQDAEGRIVETNPAALAIEGRGDDQMLGHTSSDASWGAVREDGSDFPGDQHPAMVTLRSGEPQTNVVMGIRRPDGERRWISINSEPLRGADGIAVTGVVTTFHDITERKRLDQQMADYVARLEKSMEQTLRAVANMVELRDPYTAGHEQRTAAIARDIAREMGWPEARCRDLWLITMVHDIGKIAVPAQVLQALRPHGGGVRAGQVPPGVGLRHSQGCGFSPAHRHHHPPAPRTARRQRLSPWLNGGADTAGGAGDRRGGRGRGHDCPPALPSRPVHGQGPRGNTGPSRRLVRSRGGGRAAAPGGGAGLPAADWRLTAVAATMAPTPAHRLPPP